MHGQGSAASQSRPAIAPANRAHATTGQSTPARPGNLGRGDAAKPDAQAAARIEPARAGAAKRDPGKAEPVGSAGAAPAKPLGDARIEEISNELEAEIRRQESLF